ncbi:metallophosphoesterase family protein [Hymenobacter properus]|uniref:Serine/threonine protein phosphatase n=1 Tax=Hymenobacter properus TaxID=2791026 RepID=A0A931FKV7_9BACT|nr:metallophosphoesterase family protein [Hymenobacter properus]MBF9144327.1 serine/threonine protein phosphatase [Hymenobacter properus]MBR7723145.1 serine/threonine protein phosphatase [Microvirga sp. SRT04]
MNLFLIGDVHGCFHTLQELLRRWDPATDHLIQVGDLVDRGAHIPATVELARQLNEQYPDTTTFLMGNHEDAMLHHYSPYGPYPGWLNWGGRSTTNQYSTRAGLLARHLRWLQQRPLLWQNEHVLVSHAGIGPSPLAYDRDSPDGLLWARGPLRRLEQQLQVVGHTPMENGEPVFDKTSNTLYIDTGAVFGGNLTGLRLSPTGAVLDIVMIPVFPQDLLEKPLL